jgi:hypothetical protein
MAKKGDFVGWKNEDKPFGVVVKVLTEGQNAFGPFKPGSRGLFVKLFNKKFTEVHEAQIKVFPKPKNPKIHLSKGKIDFD